MSQKFKIFGVCMMYLLILFNVVNFNNIVYSQTSNVKNNKNGIKDTRGYTASVIQYDNMKSCSPNLSERPNATQYLTYFNCGHVTINDKNKTTTRQFTLIIEENHTIPISTEGHMFHAWTYNGTVPGPTMRMTEGDHILITVINSPNSKHFHSLHMHSIHTGAMDGMYGPSGMIAPGKNFTYSFIAQPYGLYPYHCHVDPVEDHVNRGLYGMFIIDPKQPRKHMHEMAMLMNGYDMNYTDEGGAFALPKLDKKDPTKLIPNGLPEKHNDIYTVNGEGFVYRDHPIYLKQGEWYRIYLTNMLDFDLLNSFHLHGMMFNYIMEGTGTQPQYKGDMITQTVGDRGILEFKAAYPGVYMFHAHQSEFTGKGWMGYFNVTSTKSNHLNKF
ncbi:MAG TPA: multicopper oxidase domain-containing protein [Verrucomicrobiae bacterium]|nr:multicopper oxidase domain-containing protein [Verrucomicrobiae bacterium]